MEIIEETQKQTFFAQCAKKTLFQTLKYTTFTLGIRLNSSLTQSDWMALSQKFLLDPNAQRKSLRRIELNKNLYTFTFELNRPAKTGFLC